MRVRFSSQPLDRYRTASVIPVILFYQYLTVPCDLYEMFTIILGVRVYPCSRHPVAGEGSCTTSIPVSYRRAQPCKSSHGRARVRQPLGRGWPCVSFSGSAILLGRESATLTAPTHTLQQKVRLRTTRAGPKVASRLHKMSRPPPLPPGKWMVRGGKIYTQNDE